MNTTSHNNRLMYNSNVINLCLAIALSVALLTPVQGNAGSPLADQIVESRQRMEIQLVGADDLGLVQLFEYLLLQVNGVNSVEPLRMEMAAGDPHRSRALWAVEAGDVDSFDLVSQLLAIIKELDPNAQNKVLYESPFIVTEGDLVRIKETESVSIGPHGALFPLGQVLQRSDVAPESELPAGNRWSGMAGGGFD